MSVAWYTIINYGVRSVCAKPELQDFDFTITNLLMYPSHSHDDHVTSCRYWIFKRAMHDVLVHVRVDVRWVTIVIFIAELRNMLAIVLKEFGNRRKVLACCPESIRRTEDTNSIWLRGAPWGRSFCRPPHRTNQFFFWFRSDLCWSVGTSTGWNYKLVLWCFTNQSFFIAMMQVLYV